MFHDVITVANPGYVVGLQYMAASELDDQLRADKRVYGKAGDGQWTRTQTVDTNKNRRVATNITMIGANLIASTFLVCYDN